MESVPEAAVPTSTEVDCRSLNWKGMPPEGGRAGARKEGDVVPTGAMAAEAPVASLLTLISRSLTITGPPARRDKGVFGCREADVRKVCTGRI